MRDKRVVAPAEPDGDASAALEQIQRELERRGVSPEFSCEVARALAPFVAELSPGSHDAVLSGVRLAYGVHVRSIEALRKGVGELDEIQRLMGAFAPELQKLDEALEVLAAYVARLRSESDVPPQTLH